MADVHRLPDVTDIEREASEWIARLDADDVSAEDRERFEHWRSAHPRHARVYEELDDTLRQFKAAGPLVRAVSLAHSMDRASTAGRPRWRWMLAATSLAAVFSLLAWLYVATPETGTSYGTAVGEQATVSLPDGSRMELNSNSLARVEYSAHSRIVRLKRGEAFFEVAHDSERPFWVVGSDSWVRAVGTAFNVYLRASGVLVTVNEGTVKVASVAPSGGRTPSDEMLAAATVSVVTAGQQADIRDLRTTTRELSPIELARSLAWRDGMVFFENRPLSDVIAELSRYTDLVVVVEDEKLRRLPLGGAFRTSPQGTEALLTMLAHGFGLSVERESGRAYIRDRRNGHSETGANDNR